MTEKTAKRRKSGGRRWEKASKRRKKYGMKKRRMKLE